MNDTAAHAPERVIIHSLVRKLGRLTVLPEELIARLDFLHVNHRPVPRRTDLLIQGRPYGQLCVLLQGSAMRYRLLPDGRRQIINFIVPGDFIGLRGLLFRRSPHSVQTLEDAVIGPLKPSEFHELWRDYPIMQSALFWTGSIEETILNERIVSLGRRTAYERLAYFFLELLERLQLAGLARGRSFTYPLTQSLLADALGLTPVHVNRVLKRLRANGLVRFERQRVTLLDVKMLKEVADYGDGYLGRYFPRGLDLGGSEP